jgi:hypothetical protein
MVHLSQNTGVIITSVIGVITALIPIALSNYFFDVVFTNPLPTIDISSNFNKNPNNAQFKISNIGSEPTNNLSILIQSSQRDFISIENTHSTQNQDITLLYPEQMNLELGENKKVNPTPFLRLFIPNLKQGDGDFVTLQTSVEAGQSRYYDYEVTLSYINGSLAKAATHPLIEAVSYILGAFLYTPFYGLWVVTIGTVMAFAVYAPYVRKAIVKNFVTNIRKDLLSTKEKLSLGLFVEYAKDKLENTIYGLPPRGAALSNINDKIFYADWLKLDSEYSKVEQAKRSRISKYIRRDKFDKREYIDVNDYLLINNFYWKALEIAVIRDATLEDHLSISVDSALYDVKWDRYLKRDSLYD